MKDVFPFYRAYYDRIKRDPSGVSWLVLLQAVVEYGLFGLEPYYIGTKKAFEGVKEMMDNAVSDEEQKDKIFRKYEDLTLRALDKEQQYENKIREFMMEEQSQKKHFQLKLKKLEEEEMKIKKLLKESNIVL